MKASGLHQGFRFRTTALAMVLMIGGYSFHGIKLAAADVYVAASIRPLHSLVEMVLGEQGQAILLLDSATLPQDFVLRPSDRLHLSKSDLVFVIDGKFTPHVAKAVDDPLRLVEMSKAKDLVLMPRRINDAFGHGDHQHNHDHNHDHDGLSHRHDHNHNHSHDHAIKTAENHGHRHDFGVYDFNFWMDVGNAIAMVTMIEDQLMARYPELSARFQKNAEKARLSLLALDESLKAQSLTLVGINLIVYHDAFIYFENAYGLTVKTSVLNHHDAASGVRRLDMIRRMIKDGDISCIAHPLQFNPKIIDTLDPDTELPRVEMDAFGASWQAGADHYHQMMQGVMDAAKLCQS